MERLAEDSLQLNSALEAIEAGRIDEALSQLKAAAEANPENPETYYLAGLCLLRLADYEAALDAFHRAIRIEDDWPDPYLGGAQAQVGQGDPHASMQTLLHVLGFSPQHTGATRQLLELLTRMAPDSYLPRPGARIAAVLCTSGYRSFAALKTVRATVASWHR